MNKELSDRAWRCLPREVKEEVKKIYQEAENGWIVEDTLENIFGLHNLTSDAEGEDELLTVTRKDIVELYQEVQKTINQCKGTKLAIQSIGIRNVLWSFFGSKCLPDEVGNEVNFATKEPKPFKYSVGQKVILHFYGGEVSTITEAFNDGSVWNKYKVKMLPTRVWNENELDPYEEPKPSEPRFKKDDKVRIIKQSHPLYNKTATVDTLVKGTYPEVLINYRGNLIAFNESDLEPYTEPKEESLQMKPIESKVSVYIATKEEDEEFRMLLHENGFTWHVGTPLISDSCWSSDSEDDKIHYVYPEKTVTYHGDRTSKTLTFTEFKKRYFGGSLKPSNSGELESQKTCTQTFTDNRQSQCKSQDFDNILKDSFAKERRLNIATHFAVKLTNVSYREINRYGEETNEYATDVAKAGEQADA